MDLQAEKLKLVQAVLNIDDIGLFIKVENLLKRNNNWFDDLSKEQQQSVLRGLDQADNGETISHEAAIVRLGL